MRKWMVLTLLVSAVSFVRGDELERLFEKTFPTVPETVAVKAPRGMIEVVNSSAGGELKFSVHLRVQDPRSGQTRTLLDRLTPDLLAPLKRDMDAAFKDMEPRFKTEATR